VGYEAAFFFVMIVFIKAQTMNCLPVIAAGYECDRRLCFRFSFAKQFKIKRSSEVSNILQV